MIRTAIDLFAGSGGLSAGFVKAGFRVPLGLDYWKPAKATFEANHPESVFLLKDASEVNGDDLLTAAGVSEVDVLLGGPPCQGFSTAGKRALDDPRNSLVRTFLRLASELRPKFVLLENVEGFVSFVGGSLAEDVVEIMSRAGYRAWKRVLQAADYGVPQRRKRFFLVATRLPVEYRFPSPSHLNPGCTRQSSASLPAWLTFWDAVSDLPMIEAGGSSSAYASAPANDYQRARRTDSQILYNHAAPRHSEKMIRLMALVPPGKSAFDVWDEIPKELRPTSGFTNSYGRIVADEPAPTITRNFTTPSSAQCIHPYSNRALSLREGARAQSFDDSFGFAGSFTDNRLLIGNAVPPLLAMALARSIEDALEEYEVSDPEERETVLRRWNSRMGEAQLPLLPLETGCRSVSDLAR